MSDRAVLVLRVNTIDEVERTSEALPAVQSAFPGCRLIALVNPQSEAAETIRESGDFDEILLYPQAGESRSPAALRRFLRKREIEASVLCIGNSPHLDYVKPLLQLFAAPGKRYICRVNERMVPLSGAAGIAESARIVWSAANRLLVARLAPRVGPRWRRLRSAIYKTAARGRAVFVRKKPVLFRGANDALGDFHPERILWIRLDHIGDAILARPALRALYERYPSAVIDAVVHPLCRPLYANDPAVRNVFTYEAREFRRSKSRQSFIALVRRLRSARYDLALETRGDDASRVIAFLSGARRTAGPAVGPYENAAAGNCSFLLTDSVAPQRMPRLPCQASDITIGIMEELGLALPGNCLVPELGADNHAENIAGKLARLGVDGPFAALHAAPSAPYKSWPPERFAELADYLAQKYGLIVLLTGTGADRPLNKRIAGLSKSAPGSIIDGAGSFDLFELAALYQQARVVVTVDTGPMHIAAAVGAPVVALIVPWIAPIFHPYGQADGVVCSPPAEEWVAIDDTEGVQRYVETQGGMPLRAIEANQIFPVLDRKLAMPAALCAGNGGSLQS